MIGPAEAALAVRELGARSLFQYAWYQFQLRTGWLKNMTPASKWQSIQLPDDLDPSFISVATPDQLRQRAGADWADLAAAQAIERGEACVAGQLRLFGMSLVEMGFPPPWHAFAPLADGRGAGVVDTNRHWTDYDIQDLPADVKLIWEPSRLDWAIELARAYAWSGEARFAEAVWVGLLDWAAANPPNTGPNWISAQEAALRLIRLVLVGGMLEGWLNPQQRREWARWLIGHATRIPATLAYSRSQRNNHLLSEAAALYTAGIVLPTWPQASNWRRRGRELLAAGLADQVFPDGGYIQHSHNYARLALELGLWCAELGRSAGEALTDSSRQALVRLAEQLHGWMQPESGHMPNFGPNDGAWLLPLCAADFSDFRSTLQLAHASLEAETAQPHGVWDETCLWFGHKPPSIAPAKRSRPASRLPRAGLMGMTAGDGRAIVRAANFHTRPGHADQLHVDLWWKGRNLALDAGTYLYNHAPPWDNQLASALVHNGIAIDGLEPMRRAGRFLWLDWSEANEIGHDSVSGGQVSARSFKHNGYAGIGVELVRRVIAAGDHLWLVVDELAGGAEHEFSLAWLLPDAPWRVEADRLHLSLDEGEVVLEVQALNATHALYRAGERVHGEAPPSPRPQWGWTSPTYARLEPALTWVTVGQVGLPVQIRSLWSLGTGHWPADAFGWTGWGDERRLVSVTFEGERLEL